MQKVASSRLGRVVRLSSARVLVLLAAALLLALALSASRTSAAPAPPGKPTPVLSYTDRVWGDILCSGQVDGSDGIPLLQWLADATDIDTPVDCPFVILGVAAEGYQGDWRWSDVDCSNATDTLDVLAILRAAALLPLSDSAGCPTIGQTYPVAIVGK